MSEYVCASMLISQKYDRSQLGGLPSKFDSVPARSTTTLRFSPSIKLCSSVPIWISLFLMMLGNSLCVVVLALCQHGTARLWPRGFSAASSAGATVVAKFPPNVTETFDASSLFPGADVVGFPGPTLSWYIFSLYNYWTLTLYNPVPSWWWSCCNCHRSCSRSCRILLSSYKPSNSWSQKDECSSLLGELSTLVFYPIRSVRSTQSKLSNPRGL